MNFGWAGKILRIDLGTSKISTEPTNRYIKDYLGGRGINDIILYNEVTPNIHPFESDNLLIFGVGPLAGVSPLCSGRTEVTSKSPQLTAGYLGQSNFGGHFGSELKYAGFDHIVIKGKSPKPVYLWINNDNVELCDAKGVWGKGCIETQTLIQEELGDEDVKVAAIGLAGENQVLFACIVHQTSNGAGRTGLGAVMGSKNLKAVAVRGTSTLEVADPETLLKEAENAQVLMKDSPVYKDFSTYGTSSEVEDMCRIGMLPIGNFELGEWEPLVKYGRGQPFVDKYAVKSVGCQGCPFRCMHFFDVPDVGRGVTSCISYVSLTAPIWNSDTKLMFELSQLGNHYGMDWTSLGAILSWVMELFTRGIIDSRDTGGIAVERGSKEAIIKLTHMIAKRKNIGDILAQGVQRASQQIGRDSLKYAMHTRGIEKHPYEFRKFHGYALASAVGCRGDSIRANPVLETAIWGKGVKMKEQLAEQLFGSRKALIPDEYEGKAKMVWYYENAVAVVDSLSFCKHVVPCHFSSFLEVPLKLFNAITGQSMSEKTLFQIGEKICCLERMFSAREGLTRKNDSLPERFFTEPVSGGPAHGAVLDKEKFEDLKTDYYRLRGFDLRTGIPTPHRLIELGLKDVAFDLTKWKK